MKFPGHIIELILQKLSKKARFFTDQSTGKKAAEFMIRVNFPGNFIHIYYISNYRLITLKESDSLRGEIIPVLIN